MQDIIRRFWHDRRGNIALMGAATMLVVCGFAAFGVDTGSIFLDKRKAQNVADIAAIVAAGDIAHATAAAQAAVVQNNYPAGSLVAVEYGTYVANAALTPQQRFTTAALGPTTNAVRVTVQTSTPLYFGKLLTGNSSYNVTAQATATTTRMASFAIGTSLLTLNGGLLNQVLGSMLGTTLSLSVMDYQALASAQVDAFKFMSALATQIGVTAVTYSQLLAGQIKLPDMVAALLTTQRNANGNNSGTIALTTLSQALTGLTAQLTAQSLINAGPYASMVVGQTPQVAVPVSVLGLLQAMAVIANGTNQISTGLNLSSARYRKRQPAGHDRPATCRHELDDCRRGRRQRLYRPDPDLPTDPVDRQRHGIGRQLAGLCGSRTGERNAQCGAMWNSRHQHLIGHARGVPRHHRRVDRRGDACRHDQFFHQGQSAAGDPRQCSGARDGDRTCTRDNGQQLADQRHVQLRRHPGDERQDSEHHLVSVVADIEPAWQPDLERQCAWTGSRARRPRPTGFQYHCWR